MESVGPVDSGDGGALPDFSRLGQIARAPRLGSERESSQSFPACPQPVENLACPPTNPLAKRPPVGSKTSPVLVASAIP